MGSVEMRETGRRVVLVTGCTPGGIGHGLVQEFYARGLHVIATARKTSALATLEQEMTAGPGRLTTMSMDVTSIDSIESCKQQVMDLTNGRLDILVNNAGRAYPMPALDISMTEARSVFETNVLAVFALVQTFTPLLISTAPLVSPSTPPTIVQIGSISAVNPYTFGSIYNASKAALHAYSNTLRLELAPFGVHVLLVVTGGVSSNIGVARSAAETGGLFDLPKDSLYTPIKAQYDRRQTHSQEGAMGAREYAVGVVDAALVGKSEIWRGNKAYLVMRIWTWLGRWVLDIGMSRMFGLNQLAYLWVERRKKE